ncbi:GIY-YIG nuclease family protein [Patescibacteria group bacterium]|nr:GIY-YIG nuclease family protein [Patescibacteria group bacterium]
MLLSNWSYVYILQSEKDNKFYTGYTKNLKLRFEQHRRGLVESTKNRKPLNIIYYEACLNQQDATHREKYLKTYLGKMFIKNRLARWFSQSE